MIRTVAAYVAAAFAVLQVAEPVIEAFSLPAGSYRFVVILCVIGLPVTAVAAWLFDLKNGQLQRTPDAADEPARRASPLVAVGVVGGTVAVAAIATLLFRSDRTGQIQVDEQLIAVAPFRVASSDPSLGYLREGAVDLLAAKLTDSPRVVDPRTLVSAWQNTAGTIDVDLSEAAVLQLAGGLGAGRAVLGSIIGSPQSITITASLLSVPGGEVVAETTLEGAADSLTSLIDRLAVQLLGAQAGAQLDRLFSSPEATQRYLEGLSHYRRGQFDSAVVAHGRALEVDSTYAAAALSQWVAASMVNDEANMARSGRLAWAFRDRLSDRDQRILMGILGPYYPDDTPLAVQLAHLEDLTRRYPEYQEVWYLYGDNMSHFGAQAGIPDYNARAQAALERSAENDPNFFNGRLHLTWIQASLGDPRWQETSPLTPESDPLESAADGLASILPEDRQYWEIATASRDELEELPTPQLLGLAVETTSFVVVADRLGLLARSAETGFEIVSERRRTDDDEALYRFARPAFLLHLHRWDEVIAWSEANDPGDGVEHAARMLEVDAIWEGEVPAALVEASLDRVQRWWDGLKADGGLVDPADSKHLCAAAIWQARRGSPEAASRLAEELRPAVSYDEVVRSETLSIAEGCARAVEAIVASAGRDPSAPDHIAALADFLSIAPPGVYIRQLGALTLAQIHLEAERFSEAVYWAQNRDRSIYSLTFYRPMLELEERALRAQGLVISADAVARSLRLGGSWPPLPIPDPPFDNR